MAYFTPTASTKITVADFSSYVRDQTVNTFSSTANRDANIVTPVEGMFCYTSDTDNYWYYNGSSWVIVLHAGAWTSYTPSLTNVTIGNGTVYGAYARSGKTIHFQASVTFGTTTSVSGVPTLSLPVTASGSNLTNVGFVGAFGDSSAAAIYQTQPVASTTTVALYAINTSGTYSLYVASSSTVPFTWATSDYIQVSGTYMAA